MDVAFERNPVLSYAEIARRLGRAKSTIFNEVHHNRMRPNVLLGKIPYGSAFADYNAEQKRIFMVKVKGRQLKLWCSIPMIARDIKINLAPATLYKYFHQGFNTVAGYKLRKG